MLNNVQSGLVACVALVLLSSGILKLVRPRVAAQALAAAGLELRSTKIQVLLAGLASAFEVGLGAALLIGRGTIEVWSRAATVPLFALFLVVTIRAYRKGTPCGCFGQLSADKVNGADVFRSSALLVSSMVGAILPTHTALVVLSPLAVLIGVLAIMVSFGPALVTIDRRDGDHGGNDVPEEGGVDELDNRRQPLTRREALSRFATVGAGSFIVLQTGGLAAAFTRRVLKSGTESARTEVLDAVETRALIAAARRDQTFVQLATELAGTRDLLWEGAVAGRKIHSDGTDSTVLFIPPPKEGSFLAWSPYRPKAKSPLTISYDPHRESLIYGIGNGEKIKPELTRAAKAKFVDDVRGASVIFAASQATVNEPEVCCGGSCSGEETCVLVEICIFDCIFTSADCSALCCFECLGNPFCCAGCSGTCGGGEEVCKSSCCGTC